MGLFGIRSKKTARAAKDAKRGAISSPSPRDGAAFEARLAKTNGDLKSVTTPATANGAAAPTPSEALEIKRPPPAPLASPPQAPATPQAPAKPASPAIKAGQWQNGLQRRPVPALKDDVASEKERIARPPGLRLPLAPEKPATFGTPSAPAKALCTNVLSMDQVFDLMRSGKFYGEGYLFQRVLLLPEGRKPSLGNTLREWTKVYAHIGGVSMSTWEQAALDRAARDGRTIAPTSTNLANAVCAVYDQQSTEAKALKIPFPTPHTFSLSTAGKNLVIFACPDAATVKKWVTGIRLAAWEWSRMLEVYTGTLLANQLLIAEGRTPETPLKNGGFEGFLSVRLPGETEWRRLWAVVVDGTTASTDATRPDLASTDGSSTRSARGALFVRFAGRGLQARRSSVQSNLTFDEPKPVCSITFWLRKADATARGRVPVSTVSNVYSASAIFPSTRAKMTTSAFFKINGTFITRSTRAFGREGPVQQAKDGALLALAEEGGQGEMTSWLLAIMDAFKLYGRPERFDFDRLSPDSFHFGLSRLLADTKDDLFIPCETAEELVDVNLAGMSDLRSAFQQVVFEQLHGLVSSPSLPISLSTRSSLATSVSGTDSQTISTLATTPATSMNQFPKGVPSIHEEPLAEEKEGADDAQEDEEEDEAAEDESDVADAPVPAPAPSDPARLVRDDRPVLAAPIRPVQIIKPIAVAPPSQPSSAPAHVSKAPRLPLLPVNVDARSGPSAAIPSAAAERAPTFGVSNDLRPKPAPTVAIPPVPSSVPEPSPSPLSSGAARPSAAQAAAPPALDPAMVAFLETQSPLMAHEPTESQNGPAPEPPRPTALPRREQTTSPFTADNALAALLFAQVWGLVQAWDDGTKKSVAARMSHGDPVPLLGLPAAPDMPKPPANAPVPPAPVPKPAHRDDRRQPDSLPHITPRLGRRDLPQPPAHRTFSAPPGEAYPDDWTPAPRGSSVPRVFSPPPRFAAGQSSRRHPLVRRSPGSDWWSAEGGESAFYDAEEEPYEERPGHGHAGGPGTGYTSPRPHEGSRRYDGYHTHPAFGPSSPPPIPPPMSRPVSPQQHARQNVFVVQPQQMSYQPQPQTLVSSMAPTIYGQPASFSQVASTWVPVQHQQGPSVVLSQPNPSPQVLVSPQLQPTQLVTPVPTSNPAIEPIPPRRLLFRRTLKRPVLSRPP